MCEWYNECPSASSWCFGKKTIDKDCAEFIFAAVENLKKDLEKEQKSHENDVKTLLKVFDVFVS